MAVNVPVLGRLSLREYTALVLGFCFVSFETLIRILTLALPTSVLAWFVNTCMPLAKNDQNRALRFYEKSREIFIAHYGSDSSSRESSPDRDSKRPTSEEERRAEKIREAEDFEELCQIWGYTSESHVVQTKDGYMLGLHRLPNAQNERSLHPGARTRKPVVYLHHGLLMNSEVWVCLTDRERCLPFILADAGYDVWLGNNRGNKYSKKSIHSIPSEAKFWNYSIDEFCLFDIPDSIEYILNLTKSKSLSYVGFSQGTAQAFAALSIHPALNEKIDIFIALAPAMSPPDPPIFIKVIDTALTTLFNWRGANISASQKIAAYAHLYSYTSTKSVVHWFQIMRNAGFQMYDDEVQSPVSFLGKKFYQPAKFPTRNIVTPIFLLYGETDSLVDIDVMLAELPKHTTCRGVPNHEHLDMLWGQEVDELVLQALKDAHTKKGETLRSGDGAEPDNI
ncbi:alpha/beta-hydrolase lipase region [Rhizoctonia solani]|uniref:Alpha/beta-hydrolase lipase region n=1 Tax=Rhizoctonia solani TaxID=456999 RepID=A0A8H7INR1_9AGAM|nr:alpha/beta-hydrolase lipase region [Rhizoctonia solani]